MTMKASASHLQGVWVLEPQVLADERGCFFESFHAAQFAELTGFEGAFVQDNESVSNQGVLRGLHFQLAPREQGKLVRVVHGTVRDVVVDTRVHSPTFGQWFALELSAANRKQLWAPPGMAHGFLTLSGHAVVQYKVTDYWSVAHEQCIAWNDPLLAIDWQWPALPVLSEKDAQGMAWADWLVRQQHLQAGGNSQA